MNRLSKRLEECCGPKEAFPSPNEQLRSAISFLRSRTGEDPWGLNQVIRGSDEKYAAIAKTIREKLDALGKQHNALADEIEALLSKE